MTPIDSSLELVLDLVRDERRLMGSHFDALDTKAGLVLGFSGVIAALTPDGGSTFGIVSLAGSIVAAFLAVATFWLRKHPALAPSVISDYVGADPSFTKIRVVDTLRSMVEEGRGVLDVKGRILKAAISSLLTAAISVAVDRLVS